MKWRLAKLVRDKVDDHLPGSEVDEKLIYKEIDDPAELESQRQRKLGEKVIEYLVSGEIDELCDVLDVLMMIGEYDHGVSLETMLATVFEKRERLGGFDKGVGMYIATLTREEYDDKVKER